MAEKTRTSSQQPPPGAGGLRVITNTSGSIRRSLAPGADLQLITPSQRPDRRRAILIACAGPQMRRTLAAILVREGHRVTCCGDGDAALRHLGGAHADLVITDIVMPKMDGLELIRCVRNGHAGVPVVAVGDDVDDLSPVYLRYAMLAGAAGAYTFPISAAALLSHLSPVVEDGKPGMPDAV